MILQNSDKSSSPLEERKEQSDYLGTRYTNYNKNKQKSHSYQEQQEVYYECDERDEIDRLAFSYGVKNNKCLNKEEKEEENVPGAHILRLLEKFNLTRMHQDSTTTTNKRSSSRRLQQRVRMADHLRRLCTLAQAALFYLSIEARFLAFRYLPQLRDESYNVVAVSSAADTFVQAYVRHLNKLLSLMKQYLPLSRIKYVAFTLAQPASELILQELARLRDKAISHAGLARLQTDLLVMQTALQLILPLDNDVRESISNSFTRPVLFLQYILNRDVVNDLIATGDYTLFNMNEIEVLIYLVFRQVTGANDDSLAREQIKLFRQKIIALQSLHCLENGDESGEWAMNLQNGNKEESESSSEEYEEEEEVKPDLVSLQGQTEHLKDQNKETHENVRVLGSPLTNELSSSRLPLPLPTDNNTTEPFTHEAHSEPIIATGQTWQVNKTHGVSEDEEETDEEEYEYEEEEEEEEEEEYEYEEEEEEKELEKPDEKKQLVNQHKEEKSEEEEEEYEYEYEEEEEESEDKEGNKDKMRNVENNSNKESTNGFASMQAVCEMQPLPLTQNSSQLTFNANTSAGMNSSSSMTTENVNMPSNSTSKMDLPKVIDLHPANCVYTTTTAAPLPPTNSYNNITKDKLGEVIHTAPEATQHEPCVNTKKPNITMQSINNDDGNEDSSWEYEEITVTDESNNDDDNKNNYNDANEKEDDEEYEYVDEEYEEEEEEDDEDDEKNANKK